MQKRGIISYDFYTSLVFHRHLWFILWVSTTVLNPVLCVQGIGNNASVITPFNSEKSITCLQSTKSWKVDLVSQDSDRVVEGGRKQQDISL